MQPPPRSITNPGMNLSDLRMKTYRADAAKKHAALGNKHFCAKRYDEAERCFALAVENDPASAEYATERAWALALGASGDPAERLKTAEGMLRAVIGRFPYAMAHYRLGLVRQMMGNVHEACVCMRTALNLDRDLTAARGALTQLESLAEAASDRHWRGGR
jgi:tetratricopeptide (TPR) repeat protein